MAVRGAEEKAQVQAKILEMFEGSFPYDKHIRVPMGDIQIKITLAAAKDVVGVGADTAVPGAAVEAIPTAMAGSEEKPMAEPTAAEKKNISNLLKELGL